MVRFFLCFLFFSAGISAKDFGVQGHLFEIIEPDLLEHIEKKLAQLEKSGELTQHQDVLQKRATAAIRRPKDVPGIKNVIKSRVFYHDPSITVPYDLKDLQGQTFQKAGRKVNPLKIRSMTKKLVFIKGDDKKQVEWAQSKFNFSRDKLILVNGSPFELMEQLNHPVYFDQGGTLTKKLTIRAVPAVVSQEGLLLKIEEVLL